MDAEQRLVSYRQRVGDMGYQADTAGARLATVAGTAISPDGAVTVTVSPAGALHELTIGPRAEELSRVQLATVILETAGRARIVAADEAAEALRPLLGADSTAMAMLRAQLGAAAGGPR